MRASREQTAESKKRIIENSSKLFKVQGFDGIGVADLMKAASLSHGAFYTHFESKQNLCSETFEEGLNELSNLIAQTAAYDDPKLIFSTQYLSIKHRNNLAEGCAIAALGADLARLPDKRRKSTSKKIGAIFDQIGDAFFINTSKRERRQKAISYFASLVGGLILSRIIVDEKLAKEILQATIKNTP